MRFLCFFVLPKCQVVQKHYDCSALIFTHYLTLYSVYGIQRLWFVSCVNKSSAVAEMSNRGHNRHGPKRGGCCALFAGELGPRLIQVAWAEVYFRTRWRLHPFSRLATLDMNRKLGGGCDLLGGSCDPILHNITWTEVYFRTKWRLHPSSRLVTIDMNRKLGGGCAPAFLGGAETTSNKRRLSRRLPP